MFGIQGLHDELRPGRPCSYDPDFLAFLRRINREVPADLDIHLVVDNYATQKPAKVKAWLARRPRYHLHFTTTYASWLNQAERWFDLVTQRRVKRVSFRNVTQLVKTIQNFTECYNQDVRPFVWTATVQSIRIP